MQVLEEKPLSMADVKEALKTIKKRDTELTFRGVKTEEYLNQFTILKQKEAQELFEKIKKANVPRLKDDYILKIVDLLPKDATELKNILTGYNLNVSSEHITKILDIVADFLPKKK
jgi:DNA-directed RNA polymerase subunit F